MGSSCVPLAGWRVILTGAIRGDAVNFIAKFDIDDDTTELSLEAQYYDPSPSGSADYESWLRLEAEGE